MSIEELLYQRSNSSCELCGEKTGLSVLDVPPTDVANVDHCIVVCSVCLNQSNHSQTMDSNHWRCLNDSMWTPVPAVQVMAWRLLKRLSDEAWAQDLLDMLYLDEEMQVWAEAEKIEHNDNAESSTKDCHGAILEAGDSVTLIKDLEVKGAGFTAKRGTAVRNISLTANPEQIEGRVNGTRIVLLTCYLKKSN